MLSPLHAQQVIGAWVKQRRVHGAVLLDIFRRQNRLPGGDAPDQWQTAVVVGHGKADTPRSPRE
jgi:hypothetical protein